MATIAAGEIAGLSRETALEFSFLLSIPTMVAATGYDLLKTIRHPEEGAVHPDAHSVVVFFDAHGIIVLLIGFVVSFLVAWVVVAWFMQWVRSRGFTPFAIYRILAGIAVLAWQW